MNGYFHGFRTIFSLILLLAISSLSACSSAPAEVEPAISVNASPTPPANQPVINSVELDRTEVPNYESVELTVEVGAEYSNPYDQREVALDGVFSGPGGVEMRAPGFWDGEDSWKMGFTPSQAGIWTYSIVVTDGNGPSAPAMGEFTVTPSESHGWIVPGNEFDPRYSSQYLVYHDGTPFYGVGHCDALNILIDGFDVEDGVRLFDDMKSAGENFVVWWPMYSNSIISGSYDDYSSGNMNVIDAVVQDAEKEGIKLVFTIWDHPNLRDETHAWSDGQWVRNGFNKLGDIDSFFVSEEAWAWQENLYRYIIARWGYSTSIGVWQTVSEINGTNAYGQTDPWHARVNNYFATHDPYRHPTTASGSGEVDWPSGYAIMDMPQMHIYDFPGGDAVQAAEVIANWTQRMRSAADKPNWVGEFGLKGDENYPEFFHNSIWAALGAGASMTPAEWNSGGAWGRMTPEMKADMGRLAEFTGDLPLAMWDPAPLQVTVSDGEVRGWGMAGQDGGLLWLQDFSLAGASIDEVRSLMPVRSEVKVELQGLAEGSYLFTPYDTWQGVYLESFEVKCSPGDCRISLPDFKADVALKWVRR